MRRPSKCSDELRRRAIDEVIERGRSSPGVAGSTRFLLLSCRSHRRPHLRRPEPVGGLTSFTQGSATVAYSYDALDRVAARNGTPFSYAGIGWDPVGDGTQRFSQSPSGRLQAVAGGSGAGRVVVSNRHGDLRALLDPATGAVTDSVLTDPFGVPVTRTGTMNPRVGFQGDWTEPVTGDTWMGARWYTPGTATFRSRDTVHGILATPVSLNRYTYAHNNPVAYWDPDGRCVECAAFATINGTAARLGKSDEFDRWVSDYEAKTRAEAKRQYDAHQRRLQGKPTGSRTSTGSPSPTPPPYESRGVVGFA